MPRTRPGRPRRWATSPPTSWAPRPTRSGLPGRPRPTTRVTTPAAGSAGGSAPSCPDAIRELVLDDERLRNELCWFAFDC